MVHACRPELHGERHAFAGSELVAVHPQSEPRVAAGVQHGTALLRGEGTTLTEHIGPPDVGQDGVEHGAADECGVGLRFDAVRDEVRSEEGHLVHHACRDPCTAGFVLHIEAVPGLCLQIGGAPRVCLRYPSEQQPGELIVGGLACGPRGDGDPSGGIVSSRHPRLELGGPVSCEDQVGVAVHPPRQRAPTAGIVHGVRSRSLPGLPHPADALALEDDGGALQDPVFGVLGHQLADVGDEQ